MKKEDERICVTVCAAAHQKKGRSFMHRVRCGRERSRTMRMTEMKKEGTHMKPVKKQNRSIALLLAALLLATSILCSCGASSGQGNEGGSNLEKQLSGICDYLESALDGYYEAGNSACDWCVYVYGKAGRDFDYEGFLNDMERYVTECYKKEEKISSYKATDWQRICLAIKAAGGDPEHFAAGPDGKPVNLVADGTYNWSQTDKLSDQGSNALIYALIVLDSGNYEVPEGSKYTRESILAELLTHQDERGAFALGVGEQGSADITAMALQALAPYAEKDPKVSEAVENAISYLSEEQQDSGLFLNEEGYSSETVSQVIMALCSLGRDPEKEEKLIKEGGNVIDALMQFKMDDGSFAHELPDDTGAKTDNLLSSIQAGQAFEALIALEN